MQLLKLSKNEILKKYSEDKLVHVAYPCCENIDFRILDALCREDAVPFAISKNEVHESCDGKIDIVWGLKNNAV